MATVATVIAGAASQLAAAEIENPRDEMNRHFEVASEHFGDGHVQLHSRKEGPDGTFHEVHSFNCLDPSYVDIYDDPVEPRSFPFSGYDTQIPLDEESLLAPLASHACVSYGYPVLEW